MKLNTGNMTDIECSVYYTELANKLIGNLMSANNGDKMVNVIIDRIEYGLTLAEAGAKYNVSPERIRQIEAKAFRIMAGQFNRMESI